jgi:hypothetical protein
MVFRPAKTKWEPVQMHLQIGDVISSRKGFLTKTNLLDRFVSSKRLKYIGKDMWETLDDPVEVHNVVKDGVITAEKDREIANYSVEVKRLLDLCEEAGDEIRQLKEKDRFGRIIRSRNCVKQS